MNRRNFLRGLLSLPLAPLAAKLLPEVAEHVGIDPALAGSDQTSIWLVSWGNNHAKAEYFFAGIPLDAWQVDEIKRRASRDWLKESIHG